MAMMVGGPPPAGNDTIESHNVLPIGTAQELQARKNDNRNKELFVYGFTSKDYQQPSRIMSREFRKLSVDTKFKDAAAFFEMDVDNFQDLAQQYKLDVYPAFLLLNPKDTDKEVGARVTGINPGKLKSSIQEALNQLNQPVRQRPDPLKRVRQLRQPGYGGYSGGYGAGCYFVPRYGGGYYSEPGYGGGYYSCLYGGYSGGYGAM